MTPALREHYGAPADEGVLVTRVGAGPAGAGLRIGDVVVQAGRQPIRSRPQLERVLWTWNWQQPVTLSVVRGDTDSVQIVLTASEQQAGDPARRIRIRTLERELGLLQERLAAIEAELSRLRAGR